MRVVILMIQYYLDCPSGSARLAFDEAVFLAKSGHEVWVVTQDLSRSMPEYSFQDGLHVLRYWAPNLAIFDPRRIYVHQKKTKELLVRYVGSQLDLVHGHSLLHYDGALWLYGKKVRTCYSVHSPVFLEMKASGKGTPPWQRLKLSIGARIAHRIEHRCLDRSDCITVFSNYTGNLLRSLHGNEIQEKIQIIPGWVDINRFQIIKDREAAKSHLGWPKNIPVFFTLRRLVPRMGLDRLIYALKYIKSAKMDFYTIIGGEGPMRLQLEMLTRELGLEECVRFIGRVPDNILPLMYGAADAFLLPTADLECFGLIAIEALACGTPVLATPVGAIPEVIGRFEKKWLAEDSSATAIAKLLTDFLRGILPSHDPAELRAIVTKYYSQEKAISCLVSTALGIQDLNLN